MLFKSMDACTDSIIFKVIASNKEKANAVAGSCYVARPAILATRIRLNIISAREEIILAMKTIRAEDRSGIERGR